MTRTHIAITVVFALVVAFAFANVFASDKVMLGSVPPVIVRTTPVAGTSNVDPKTSEIRITFSKVMSDRSWSWVDSCTQYTKKI